MRPSVAPFPLSNDQRRAYLRRLGVADDLSASEDTLRLVHRAHLRCVPFENLDIHLGTPISLQPEALYDKIVQQRRGGFCYELNASFAALLQAIGYEVTMAEARVYGDGGGLGIRYDHMCLIVQLDEPYLADVGFGAAFDEPLRLTPDHVQDDPAGSFLLSRRIDGWWDLEADSTSQYRFDPSAKALADFAGGCRYHQSDQASHFTRHTVCSRRTSDGRVTVRGSTAIETVGGTRTERELDADELRTHYQTWFGFEFTSAELGRLLDPKHGGG